MKTKEIDILDILLILAKHKWFIIITTTIVSIAAVIYSLLATQYWLSTATILPAQEQRSQLSLGSSSLLGLGSSLLGGSFQTQGQDLITIMNSRTFAEDVVKEFDLIDYFELEDSDSLVVMELAVESLKNMIMSVGINEENGLIGISAETKDKYLSAGLANYYWSKLEKYNIESRMSKGKQKRIFIETRLQKVKSQLDSLLIAMNNFQKSQNMIDLENQTKSVIALYSDLVAQKISSEIELEYQQNYFDNNSQIISSLTQKIAIIKEKITNLEFSGIDQKIKYGLNLNEIPDISLKYAKLLSQIEIQTKIYEFLYPQFESAKIEEVKDLPTIEIIDKAVPAGNRSKPKRAIICIISFICALLLSSLLTLILDAIKCLKNDNDRYEKVQDIYKALKC